MTLLLSLHPLGQSLRSQQIDPLLIPKPPKPCFWETETLPSPPLSQTELSIPNLWLAQELYGYSTLEPEIVEEIQEETDIQLYVEQPPETRQPYELLETWYVEPKITQLLPDLYVNNLVTIVVNRINWNREKYLGQYVFLTRFGSVTRSYGYNLRVCNRLGDLLAYYVCNFEESPLNCDVQIRSEGFRIRDFRNFNPE
ncbi:hypothetical protein ACL6C3_21460 [Capilliphycus salinus ALCB114379]|uniref:hypothetical protein n=1 Tax=Capilliphycus salinus TaxID=2768948 RepID=UPI0039A594F8